MDARVEPYLKIIRDLYHADKDHLSRDEQMVKSRLRLVCFLVLAVRKRSGPGFIPRSAVTYSAAIWQSKLTRIIS